MSDKSPEFTDELLSAYFDGEVTAEERAVVKAQLASSSEANLRLNEYGELREALQSLPALSAPAELKAGVMERLSPLPTARGNSTPPGRPGRRWLAPAVTTMALVAIFAVSALRMQQAQHQHMAAAPAESMISDKMEMPEPAPADGPANVEALDDRGVANRMEKTDGSPPVGVAMRRDAGSSAEADAMRQRLMSLGKAVSPGEMIEYLDQVGEQPVIQTFTVVDVVQALDKMHVLLQREGMRPVGSVLDASVLEGIKSQVSGQTIAVYLEVPSEEMDSLMKELPVLFEAPEPAAPEAVAEIPPPSPEPAPGKGVSSPTAEDPVNVQEASPPAPAPKSADGPPTSDFVDPAAAFQLVTPLDEGLRKRLGLPQELLRNQLDSPDEGGARAGSDVAPPLAAPSLAGNQTARKQETQSARRGVILILRPGQQ